MSVNLQIWLRVSVYKKTIVRTENFCVSCLEGKMDRKYNKQSSTRASKKLDLIHSDLCGPFPTNSVSGSRYFIIFVDDATRMTWVYCLKSKGAEEVLQIFQHFKAHVEK